MRAGPGLVVFIFVFSLLYVEGQDVTCGKTGKTSKKVVIKSGESFTFRTQSGTQYGPKVTCKVTYKKQKKCPGLRFSCESFSVNSPNSKCKGGDRLQVWTKETKTKKFCKTSGPDVTTTGGTMKVVFFSNKKKNDAGAVCTAQCTDAEKTTTTPTTTPSTSTTTPTTTTTTTSDTTAVETTLRIVQTWSQETDYERTAEISIPARTAGQKFPVVIDIHGFGGQGNLQRMGSFLGDDCIIVAPNGYERSWNILSEASKAPDVEFIQLLIQKVGEDYPQAADLSDVTIIGTSNGAALIYRLLIEVENPRPFKRVIPMVSSMINKQYNNDQFWKPSCDDCGEVSNFDTPVVPSSPGPEFIHIHGTNDGTVPYLGGGGAFLGDDVDFIGAQENDYLFAKAFGFDGLQLDDNAGTEVVDGMFRYSYTTANGEVSHYKLVDGTHNGFGAPYTNDVKDTIKNAILG